MDILQVQELRGLKARLAAIFLLAALALIAAAVFYYRHHQAHLISDAEELLRSTAVFKEDQLLHWRQDRLDRTASLLDSPILSIYLEKLAAEPGDREPAALLKKRLENFVSHNRFYSAYLVDQAGKIRVSAGAEMKELCRPAADLVKSAPVRPVMGDLHHSPDGKSHGLHIVAPAARSPSGARLYLVLTVKPEDYLYPLIQKWPGPSPSGETLLIRRDGEHVIFLNELRHASNTALKLRLPLKPDLPAAMAASGRTGIVRGTDYRGRPVLAYLSTLPEFGWYMVTKVDMGEVLSHTNDLEVLLLLGVLLFMGAVGYGAYAVFSAQTLRLSGELGRASAERLRALQDFEVVFRTSADGKSITSVDGTVRPNQALCEMLGYTEEELRARNWREITPKEDISPTESILKDLLEGRKDKARFEKRYVRKDGAVIWGDISTAIHRNEAGKPEYFITSVVDITARKQLEESLRLSEQFTRAVMDNLPIGIAVNSTKESVKFQYINDRFPQFYRTTREALKEPDAFWEAVYEDPVFRAQIRERVLDDCASGDPARMRWTDIPITRKGEKTRYITAQNIPLPGKDLMISMVEDVTDRKLSELRIEKLNRGLVEKNQEMENFLYITTHDLRSPLVNIQGFSRNLFAYQEELQGIMGRISDLSPEDGARLRELGARKVPEALGFILDSSRKMDALISALLKVSRAGRVEMQPERVEPAETIHKLLDAMRFQLNEAGAKVHIGSLPACLADPGALGQVFANLLDNAVKYRDKTRPLAIGITGERLGEKVAYTVADNGPGIPASDLGRIWNVFYSGSGPAAGKGEGIGLAMVKRLVDKNGGAITASSKEGEGTSFRIEMPAPAED